MSQFAKIFRRAYLHNDDTSKQLNDFLKEHPNYRVDQISFDSPKGSCIEKLFVVFSVKEG